jgi:glutamyl-tRNA reductase
VRGEDPQRVLEELSRALTNKLLHAPTHALNHASMEEREALAATLGRLYHTE